MRLRSKLAVLIAGTAALVAALIGVLVHEQTARTQLGEARDSLDDELVAALEEYDRGVDAGLRTDPEELPEALREAVTAEPVRATYLARDGDEPVLWAASTDTSAEKTTVLAVSRSYATQADALAALDRTLLGAGAVAATMGLVLGVGVATVAERRIAASARTAQRIADGDLSARVRPRGRDEIARMGEAVNTMADALGARLEAERRITADIAHELRTPVAGLVTAAELLPPGRPTELVRDRAGALRRVVDDVLEVARLDADGVEHAELEVCRTADLARQAVAAVGAAEDVTAELRVVRDTAVRTDPRRVARVLENLLVNAARHGAPPVVVTVDAPTVRVRDHGPGFPPALLEALRTEGPQRFRTGRAERGRGTGLGLTIAGGQARLLDAVVGWANAEDGGAEITVTLPDAPPEAAQAPAAGGP